MNFTPKFSSSLKEQHHANLALTSVINHDYGDMGFAVDGATPRRDVVAKLRADNLEGPGVA